MRRSVRVLLVPAVILTGVVAPACSSDSSSPAAAEQNVGVVLLDVRTPDEFAGGHLEGAVNLDFEGGALEAALADLDPSATYQVYCQSGRRSALAVALLLDHGFTQVTDLGGLAAAEQALGLPVITG